MRSPRSATAFRRWRPAGSSRALAAAGPPGHGPDAGQRRRRDPRARPGATAAHGHRHVGERDARADACSRARAALSDAQLLVLARRAAQPRAETAALLGRRDRVAGGRQADRARGHHRLGRAGGGRALRDLGRGAAVRAADRPHRPAAGPAGSGSSWGRCCSATTSASHSLVALGCLGANAIIAPSPSAARATESDPGARLARLRRTVRRVRFGCDDPPNDPASDPALPATSAPRAAGKAECRRALARRCSLALGPRTLLLTTGPLHARRRDGGDPGGASSGSRRSTSSRSSCPAATPSSIERAGCWRSSSRARAPSSARRARRRALARGAADAILLGDDHDRIGRAAGTGPALRDAAHRARRRRQPRLPGRLRPGSRTGQAILYSAATPFEIESAVRRALALRADGDVWAPLANGSSRARPAGRPAPRSSKRSAPATIRRPPQAWRCRSWPRSARELGDTHTELSVDVHQLAARPGATSDDQVDRRARAAESEHAPLAERQHLVAAQDDPSQLGDDSDGAAARTSALSRAASSRSSVMGPVPFTTA